MKKRPARRAKRTVRKKPFKYKSGLKTMFVFALFVVSTLTLVGLFAYKNVTKSFTSALSNIELISGKSDISSQQLTSVLYISVDSITARPLVVDNVIVVFLDNDTQKIVTYKIDPHVVVDVQGKFGQEELSKVVALGSMEDDTDVSTGVQLLKQTVTRIFAYGMDRYILVDKSIDKDFSEFLIKGDESNFSLSSLSQFKDNISTDMNVKEIYDVQSFISSLPDDRFTNTNLNQSAISNTDSIDSDIQNMTFDSPISSEKKTIAILNGTRTSGIASLCSRIVANMGGRVIAAENANHNYAKSILVVDDPNSQTVKTLQKFFGFTVIAKKSEVSNIDENTLDRSDITLIIGLDIAKSL